MTESRTCAVVECGKQRYQKSTLCVTHKMRKHRYGDVHADRRRKAAPSLITSNGYRKKIRRGHLLADGDGYVYEHRFVLHGAIGPGTHNCHWRSRPVTWGVDLEADHVDGDRLNNDIVNLVPSCHGCNTRRALGERWRSARDAYI